MVETIQRGTVMPPTDDQLKYIWSKASELWGHREAAEFILHIYTISMFGKDSLKLLDVNEAAKLIDWMNQAHVEDKA